MAFFGKKKREGTVVAAKAPKTEGWLVECAPLCGFMARDHNQPELVQIVKMHMKTTHKTNLTDAEASASVKPTSWGG